jgi:hypothetical protein
MWKRKKMSDVWPRVVHLPELQKSGRRGVAAVLLSLLPFIFLIAPASAQLFYTGGVQIDSLSARLDVTTAATVSVEYKLVNHGTAAEALNLTVFPSDAQVTIGGANLTNPVAFEAGQTKELTLLYSIELPSGDFQRIQFAPMLFFNDMASAHRIKSYRVELVLPQGVDRLVSSSLAYDSSTIRDGRPVFTWAKDNIYPVTLDVCWTTLDVDIAAVKKATPSSLTSAGEIVQVEITIQNKGDSEVTDITLIDSFFPGAFQAVEPLDDFKLVQPEMSDPRLYWQKDIDRLEAGESRTYTYSVNVTALGLETRLDPVSVLVNGIPVAVSNDIVLYSELGGGAGEGGPRGFPMLYFIIGAAVLVAIIVSVFVARSRKKA